MTEYVERIHNLIRVVSAVSDERFDIRYWWNPLLQCGCAIGHALRDEYFINNGLNHVTDLRPVAEFLNISSKSATDLFVGRTGYGSRISVLAALRVLLMEKEADLVAASAEKAVELLAADITSEIVS